jgi:hypothetical protein
MSTFKMFADELLLQHDPREYYIQKMKEAEVEVASARKHVPITDDDALKAKYPKPEELHYMLKRQEEFCKSLAQILHDRLQPGFAKRRKHLEVGQCPFPVFDWWFGYVNEDAIRTQRTPTVTVNGIKKPRRRFYYKWRGSLPNLKFDYHIHDHGRCNGKSVVQLKSHYIDITLSIDETSGRVWCDYDQESFVENTGMLIF